VYFKEIESIHKVGHVDRIRKKP